MGIREVCWNQYFINNGFDKWGKWQLIITSNYGANHMTYRLVVIADDRLVSCNYAAPADCHLVTFTNNINNIKFNYCGTELLKLYSVYIDLKLSPETERFMLYKAFNWSINNLYRSVCPLNLCNRIKILSPNIDEVIKANWFFPRCLHNIALFLGTAYSLLETFKKNYSYYL